MPRPRSRDDVETPKVLDKAILVLEAFTESAPERSEKELCQELSLPTSTVNRIVRGLERHGFLFRTASRRYRLGPSAVRLGRRAAASFDPVAAMRPALERLALATRELVLLAVPALDGKHARYTVVIDSPQRLRVTAEVGSAVPLTAGATARAILAHLSPEAKEAVLASPLEPLAAGTLLDPAVIRRELERTRESGFARSWEETYDGAWSVAAPVLDEDDRPTASIGIAAPIHRHTPAVESAALQAVLRAAATATAAIRGQTG